MGTSGTFRRAVPFVAVCFFAGCGTGQGAQTPATAARAEPNRAEQSPAEPNRAEAEYLIARLSAGDANAAEKRFSADMREKVPPPQLLGIWRNFLARNGPFRSYSVVRRDELYAKERYTLELDFTEASLQALVVFEPSNGEIIGLFFSNPAPTPKPTTAPPPDPDVEELPLTVGAPPAALGASLTLPRRRTEQRFIGVLLVAGSGPQDRDETVQRVKPLRDLAYGLGRRGIVALRFDKRTFAHPELFAHGQGTVEEEVIADAIVALGLLRSRPEVDPKRVFVVGHSLGAGLAPEIAKRGGGAAGLVLIAASARPLPELLLEQLRVRGESEANLAPLEAKVRALPSLPPDATLLGVPARYWQDLGRRDEIRVARELDVPILYVRGELDRNVFAEDQQRWADAFRGNARFENVTLPGLNHLLVPNDADLGSEVHVPDDVSARLADFMARVSAPRSSP
jgi:fermentation-respiration switch protein FrsA (DUF1100 family)